MTKLTKETMVKDLKAFRINRGTGFQVTFPNGYTLSTQFGEYNYCEHYPLMMERGKKRPATFLGAMQHVNAGEIDHQSKNAEIAIIDGNGDWATKKAHKDIFKEDYGDDVVGYVGIIEWFKYLEWTSKRRKKKKS